MVNSYNIPWLIWNQMFVFFLLLLLLCVVGIFSLDIGDNNCSSADSVPSTSGSSLSKRFLSGNPIPISHHGLGFSVNSSLIQSNQCPRREDLSSHQSQIQSKIKVCEETREKTREIRSKLLDRFEGPPRLILVTDLDSTLVDHDDPENTALLRFNALWEAYFRHDSLLVYSTGRSLSSYLSLRKTRPLLMPDIAITSVGSEIVYSGESMVTDDVWAAGLDDKWNRDIVVEETSKFPQLEPQPAKSQEQRKVSFFVEREHAIEIMKVLPARLEKHGVDVKLVYSNGYAFDVLPRGAGKKGALAYLLEKLETEGKQPSNTLVCGDSGNDVELFDISQVYGVMVSNSHEELLQWYEENAKDNPNILHASERCGAGIIEAIRRFNLGPSVSPRDVWDSESFHTESLNPAHEVVQFYLFYERWRCVEVEKSDKYLQNLKSLSSPLGIFVHPSGVEKPIHEWIDEMENLHGDGKEKKFRIWLDKVSTSHISSDTWLARFDKHELSEGKVRSCSTKVLLSLSYKEEKQRLTWMHIHQSWLDDSCSNDQEKWIF